MYEMFKQLTLFKSGDCLWSCNVDDQGCRVYSSTREYSSPKNYSNIFRSTPASMLDKYGCLVFFTNDLL